MLEPSQVLGAAADLDQRTVAGRWAALELDRLRADTADPEAGEELGQAAIEAAVVGLAALELVVDQLVPVTAAAVGHKHYRVAEGVEDKEHTVLCSVGHKANQRRQYLV